MSKEKKAQDFIKEVVAERVAAYEADIQQWTRETVRKIAEEKGEIEIAVPIVVGGKKMSGNIHKDFELLLKVISTKEPIFVYGPAGSGKTHTVVQVGQSLGLDVYSISVNEQTTKTDFLGYYDATSHLIRTAFREAYEHGGMFILDEIDAANPNVLTVLNSALSNDFMTFPDGLVHRNKRFYCVCTANTTGDEVNVQYVGRNVLDAATLDRFIRVFFDYDDALENKLLTEEAKAIRNVVRRHIKDNGLNDILSTRTLKQIDKLAQVGLDYGHAFILAMRPSEDLIIKVRETLEKLSGPKEPTLAEKRKLRKKVIIKEHEEDIEPYSAIPEQAIF